MISVNEFVSGYTYMVIVYQFSEHFPLVTSEAKVTLYSPDGQRVQVEVPNDLPVDPQQRYWLVGCFEDNAVDSFFEINRIMSDNPRPQLCSQWKIVLPADKRMLICCSKYTLWWFMFASQYVNKWEFVSLDFWKILWNFLNFLESQEFSCIFLNFHKYSWIFLIFFQFFSIFSNFWDFYWISGIF